jgi:type III pantothenate kinase
MLLAVDIGNTNIVLGVYDNNRWVHHWRVQTVRGRTADEYSVIFQGLFREAALELSMFRQTVLSSVVPPLTQGIARMLTTYTSHDPLIIRPSFTNIGLEIRIEQPARIGSDLVANAVAAYDLFRSSCIVVDFGTATTFTAVAEPGALLGVAIAAGLNVTHDALVSHTAQLPHVALEPPPSIIGRNTVHAMQAGLVLGYVSMVEGIIKRIKSEMGSARVIATGGLSSVIGPLTDSFDAVEPWLTLDGLRLIADRNH